MNHTAASPIKMTAMNGMGVSMNPTKRDPRRARIKSVRRSPRQVATGAVMLSIISFGHSKFREDEEGGRIRKRT